MPRKKKYNREEVTEKAMQVFWNNGYKATSMRALEEAMGINLYSIYAEFDSKEGVFLETLKRYQQLNKNVILKQLIDSQGDLEDIRQFFYGFVNSVKTGKTPNGCLFANTAMEFGETDEKIMQQLHIFFKLIKKAYVDLLEKAKQKGDLSPSADIHKYANYLITCTEGLSLTAKVLEEQQLSDFIETSLSVLK